jgi:hypothetical protein
VEEGRPNERDENKRTDARDFRSALEVGSGHERKTAGLTVGLCCRHLSPELTAAFHVHLKILQLNSTHFNVEVYYKSIKREPTFLCLDTPDIRGKKRVKLIHCEELRKHGFS